MMTEGAYLAFFFVTAVFFFAVPHVPHLAIRASSDQRKQGRRMVQRRAAGKQGL